MRTHHISLAAAVFALAVPFASAQTFRLPTSTPVRLPVSSSSTTPSSAKSSESSVSSVSSKAQSSSSKASKNNSLADYCASISMTLTKAEKVKADEQTMKKVDQTYDLLKKAEAICLSINAGAESSVSSSTSSKCAPDGFMGVKGTCNGKTWSTGGVCMPKSYWEQSVKQSCSSTMANVSYEKPCVTKDNKCAAASSPSTASSVSSCMTEGFMGAKISCSGKPLGSGGVCKPKAYWEAWAKQSCSSYTGFEVQVPCTLSCTK